MAWETPFQGRVIVIESQCTLETLDTLLENDFDASAIYPVVESFQSRVKIFCRTKNRFFFLKKLFHKVLLGFVSGYDLLQYRTDIIRKLEFASRVYQRSGSSLHSSLTRSFSLVDENVLHSLAQSPSEGRLSTQTVLDRVQETIKPIKLSKGFSLFFSVCFV